MLISGSQLIGTPVMSLQTGKELAETAVAIINPHNLTVIAYQVTGKHLDFDPAFIRIADVRELGNVGMIIDSSEELIGMDDIIKKKDIYELAYELRGKRVIDEHGKKIGKVDDYILDIESFTIQKIAVHRPIMHSFMDAALLVHRSQVVEVNDDSVIIKSSVIKKPSKKQQEEHHFTNPFRQAPTQPETIRIDDKR